MHLPENCQLRPATAADMGTIRGLVLRAMLDPTQLRSQQFWVVTHQDDVIACGQLRRHGAAQELGSLVVRPGWRGQGIGTTLTHHLIAQAEGALYLECLGQRRADYYAKFGFKAANWPDMPTEIAAKFRVSRWIARFLPISLNIMELMK